MGVQETLNHRGRLIRSPPGAPLSLYAQYVEEREGASVYESERGFLVYQILGPEVYVKDLYVRPDFRNSGEAADMANQVAALAKAQGCLRMSGSVCPRAKGATDSLKVLLAYGMKLHSIGTDGLIYFVKDI